MASTFSNLKIELITTGEQSGTWGNTTNTNLGTAIEESIVGSADVTFASADVTVTLINSNATQTARHFRLRLVGSTGGSPRNLILGSGCQISKPYLVYNTCNDAITVKNTTGTGVSVPSGKSVWLYNNGTDVVSAVDYIPSLSTNSLTLSAPLPIASGGTGQSNASGAINALLPSQSTNSGKYLTTNGSVASWSDVTTLPLQTGNSGKFLTTNGLTASWDYPVVSFSGGTTGLTPSIPSVGDIVLGGTLAIANGGTGATTASTAINALLPSQSGNNGKFLTTDGSNASWANVSSGGGGTVTSVAMSVPQFLSVSGSPITSSGTFSVSLSGIALPATSGGTGQTSYSNGQLLIGNAGGTLTKATLSAGSGINITNGSGSVSIDLNYPSAGLAVSTGSGWTTSKTAPSGAIVGTVDSQTLTNKTLSSGTVISGSVSMGTSIITNGSATSTASGTAIGFTGIPSWVKRITLIMSGVTTNGTLDNEIQVGTSGGYVASGYVGGGSRITGSGVNGQGWTSGLLINTVNANVPFSGHAVFTLLTNTTWVGTLLCGGSASPIILTGGTTITLSGVLDRIQIKTTGSSAFNGGTVNILYE